MQIAITGAEGKVGEALIDQLDTSVFDVTALDVNNCDVRSTGDLIRATQGHDALVHLAWRDINLNLVHPDNRVMYEAAYRAAEVNGIGLVIMGSSNHARVHTQLEDDGHIRYTGAPEVPNNPYGLEKQRMERRGSQFAKRYGLRVICLRIGNVNPDDQPNADEPTRWMSHRDLGGLVTAALQADLPPGHFEVVYGVSRQDVFDWTNTFGFEPKDTAVAAK